MTPWTMFGTHPLFGDYVDAIHSGGGILSRVVQNVVEPPRPEGQRLGDRLDRYRGWLEDRGIRHWVEVEPLAAFEPREGERYLLGFRGPKARPLIRHLRERFGLRFEPLVHASANISPMSWLGEGVFIGAGCKVGPDVTVGDFTLINRAVVIEHDCEIGPFAIIGPGAAIGSATRIESGAILGIGAMVIEHLRVGEGSYVAGGAAVIRDVPGSVLVAGIPAVEKKKLPPKRNPPAP